MEKNNIRKISAFGIASLLLLLVMQSVSAQTTINNVLSITDLRIVPQPVVAGDNVSVYFSMFNAYSSALTNVNIQITADSPILNISPASSYLTSAIGAGVYEGGSTPFTFFTRVPSTLTAGEYTIDVVANYESEIDGVNYPGTSTMPINLYVYGIPSIQLTATPRGAITPGGQSNFTITAINVGTDTARNVSISIINSPNFTAYGPSKLNLGLLSVGSTASTSVLLQTSSKLRTGQIAIPVQLNYTAESGIYYSNTIYIPLNFVTGSPNIVASIESAIPSHLGPGSNQTATILIQNNGYGEAKNLTIRFLDSGPLSVTGSATSYFIGNLQEGAETTEQIQLTAGTNASQNSYNLPVVASYSMVGGGNTTQTSYIPVQLQNTAVFNITAVVGTLTAGGNYQPVTFTIRNTGNEPAQEVTLSLQTVFPLTPVNPNFYINSLAPGQSTNVTFYVNTASNGNNGAYPVTVYEQWRQPNGYTTEQYSSSSNYYATVGTTGSDYTTYAIYAVIVIVVIIGGRYYYKNIYMKRKEKKKEKHE